MLFYEVLLLSVALAMDACAVGMTNGMTEKHLPLKKQALIGATFGFFQFLMPLIGYFLTSVIAGVFLDTFSKISSWLSFILLAFLGIKMLVESVCEMRAKKDCACEEHQPLTATKLLIQAIATSIDALAVGVTLQMATLTPQGLALGVWGSTALIGVVTFVLATFAVWLGKKIGDGLSDKAGVLGGIVLIGIGVKILLEGLL